MTEPTDPLREAVQIVRERSAVGAAPRASDILRELRDPRPAASDVVEQYFRSHKELGSADRALISDLVYGYVRWKRRLLEALSRSGWRGRGQEPAACALLLAFAGYSHEIVLEAFPDTTDAVDLSAAAEIVGELDPTEATTLEQLALRTSFPIWIVQELSSQYGFERTREITLALRRRAPAMLRANVLKRPREQAASRLAADGIETRPSRHSPWGIEMPRAENITATAAFRSGLVEPQDEASQLAALLCSAAPGMTIIDACAGAGGKSLAMAATMENRGSIVAADVDTRKLAEARRRADRAGVTILTTVALRRRQYPPQLRGEGDVVLVDAPCTGSGTWRRIPDGPEKLRRSDVAFHQQRQLDILRRAAALVKPDGRLVYATCSLFEAENQQVVSRWLESETAFSLQNARGLLPPELSEAIEDGPFFAVTPDRSGMDGFFAAVFQRSG